MSQSRGGPARAQPPAGRPAILEGGLGACAPGPGERTRLPPPSWSGARPDFRKHPSSPPLCPILSMVSSGSASRLHGIGVACLSARLYGRDVTLPQPGPCGSSERTRRKRPAPEQYSTPPRLHWVVPGRGYRPGANGGRRRGRELIGSWHGTAAHGPMGGAHGAER